MLVCSTYEHLRATTAWQPEIALAQTLADTVEWWLGEIRADRAPVGGSAPQP